MGYKQTCCCICSCAAVGQPQWCLQLCWRTRFRRQGSSTVPHANLHARPAWTAAVGWSRGWCCGSFLHCQTADALTGRSGPGVRQRRKLSQYHPADRPAAAIQLGQNATPRGSYWVCYKQTCCCICTSAAAGPAAVVPVASPADQLQKAGRKHSASQDLHARPAWTAAVGRSLGWCCGSFLHCQTAVALMCRSGPGVR